MNRGPGYRVERKGEGVDVKDMDALEGAIYELKGCGLLIHGLSSLLVSFGEPDDDRALTAAFDSACSTVEGVLERAKVTASQ